MINLCELIDEANEMAPLSPTSVRLAKLIGQPNYYIEEAVELVAFDQALTLKLLQAANCAASGRTGTIGSVEEALSRLGMAQVLSLTIASTLKTILKTGLPFYNLGEGELWRHSIAAAICVEAMQMARYFSTPPEAFTAALLHDVGKLVMSRFLQPETAAFLQRACLDDKLGQMDAENLLLEVNHGELGGLIAQHWNLPPRIVQGITYHHHPDAGQDPICDVTYLANQLAKHVEAGLAGGQFNLQILPSVVDRLQLSEEKLEYLCSLASSRYSQVSARYKSL